MEILELMKQRHSVRKYQDKEIEIETKNKLNEYVEKINKESGLNVQVFYNEPNAFKNPNVTYGWFVNANNYIALIGTDDETAGYYGEKIVLKAQELGLNTCWVVLTYDKGEVKFNKNKDEKLICVITVGYGIHNGRERNSKDVKDVLVMKDDKEPELLSQITEACLLAPTARNLQRFNIVCNNGDADIEISEMGEYVNIDLGIVKCHKDLITNKTELD